MNDKIQNFFRTIGAYTIIGFFIVAPLYGMFYFGIKLIKLLTAGN